MKHSNRGRLALIMVSAAGCITGCAVDVGSGDEPEAQVETSAEVAASPVQRFLDQRYQAADVHHSFKTKLGETIDCVDFFAEPGVKAMAARGTPITAIPHFELPAGLAAKLAKPGAAPRTATDSVAFRGELDEDGHARACPDGTVAELRITPEHIARAGGLDAFENAASHKGLPPRGSAPPGTDTAGYAHITVGWEGVHVQGGISTMSIANPHPPEPTSDHSLAQTWTYGGSTSGAGCGTSCLQTVEAGWNVDQALYGDLATHLFIYGTADGYINTGCYNNWSSTGHCLSWIPVPGSSFALGQALTASVSGGAKHELTVYTLQGAPGAWPGWVITVCDDSTCSVLGYYPITDYGTGPMKTAGSIFQAGGEVYNQTNTWNTPPTVQMGMGGIGAIFPATYGATAYHHDYEYWSGSAWVSSTGAPSSTRTGYTWSQSAAAGGSWTNYFYYGDVIPLIFLPPG